MGSEEPKRSYSSRDLHEVAGLTPRQQNDWDSRGALPHDRDADEGWRRFTPREIFVLAICAEIRRKFGTPVERLKYVQDFMLQDGANHFEAAIELVSSLGIGVWLLTDFEKTFIMDSELEFIDLWNAGYFSASHESSFVLVNVTALVKRVLACFKEPIRLEAHGRGYELRPLGHAWTQDEAWVLSILRRGEFDRVEVELASGAVKTIRATSRVDPAVKVEDLLSKHDFQQIRLIQKNGRVVSIAQELTEKPPGAGS